MCGTAGLQVDRRQVVSAVQKAGVTVCERVPDAYRTGTTKRADSDSFPCVVKDSSGALALETLDFGVKRFKCHNAFLETWLERKTWREAAFSERGRCAMVCTSFVEGITVRRPDDGVFFVLGFRVDDAFVRLAASDALGRFLPSFGVRSRRRARAFRSTDAYAYAYA